LNQVNYNDLNYGSSEAVTVTMQIRFDNAVQTPNGTGVGSSVARLAGSVVTGVGAGFAGV
jgi:hypothetical protein